MQAHCNASISVVDAAGTAQLKTDQEAAMQPTPKTPRQLLALYSRDQCYDDCALRCLTLTTALHALNMYVRVCHCRSYLRRTNVGCRDDAPGRLQLVLVQQEVARIPLE